VTLLKPALYSFTDAEVTVDWATKLDVSKLLPTHLESQLSMNKKLINELSAEGDNGTVRRQIDHWIFLNDDTRLDQLKMQLALLGYSVEDQHEKILRFSKETDALHETLNAQTVLLNELCDTYGCFYDGWSTTVIRR
jgi:regulator of RNase E activity RraB